MRESCTSGSVRGVLSNEHPYRDRALARRAHAIPPVRRTRGHSALDFDVPNKLDFARAE